MKDRTLAACLIVSSGLLVGCSTRVLDLGGDRASDGGGGEAGAGQGSSGTQTLADGARIFTGGNSTCLLRADGVVKCWGQNDMGQLAVETTFTCGAVSCSSVPVTAPALEGSSKIALGQRFGCAISAEGSVRCWGENTFAELGRGAADEDAHLEPRSIGLDDVTELAAGSHHACARTSAGKVMCWGLGEDGQLGLDPAGLDADCALEPTEVPAFEGAVELALGDAHSCARFEDGRVVCVGRNDMGQLGAAVAGGIEPVEVLAGGADAIAVGAEHSCALLGTEVHCWGSHARGQVGVGTAALIYCASERPCALEPRPLVDLPDADALSLGAYFSCARLTDQTVRCWGDDSAGQLGNSSFDEDLCQTADDGTFDCLKRPLEPVYDLSGVADFDAGASHACAVVEGELRCWGASESGQAAGHDAAVTFPSTVYGLQ